PCKDYKNRERKNRARKNHARKNRAYRAKREMLIKNLKYLDKLAVSLEQECIQLSSEISSLKRDNLIIQSLHPVEIKRAVQEVPFVAF
ncbi:17499_t:CDS:1, partial [Cetraspora pellucida]